MIHERFSNPLLALAAGALLALMIGINSLLASFNSPLFASWVAHGVGAITAWLLLLLLRWRTPRSASSLPPASVPRWAYLGGIPGALTVVLAAITVNSPLALSGSLALMLTGQVLFGMVSDSCGWFGVIKRRLSVNDVIATLLILSGCALLIFLR
ncbi:transporter family-2 protein [Serratia sp. PL17]|uniref:DMT family transporter n=1 Tax=Serratia sp. PL17 TaxID=2806582 RepID=UPI001AE6E445|nr:DMT family transporter [Serratia sp. PL17]MBP1130974.1 transporter family-2 protein [Serratia sp. PL17]